MPPKTSKMTKTTKLSKTRKKAIETSDLALDSSRSGAGETNAGSTPTASSAQTQTADTDTTAVGASSLTTIAEKDPQVTKCSLCSQKIVDGKEDALYCEGICKQWCHRYCAGVSLNHFHTLSTSSVSFYCAMCSQSRCESEMLYSSKTYSCHAYGRHC